MSSVSNASRKKHLLAVLLFYVVSFCFAMFQGGFVSWFIFFVMTPFVLYACLLAVVPLTFQQVTRTWSPSKIEAGDDVTITVTFERKNRFPLLFMLVEDDIVHTKNALPRRTLFVGGFKKYFTWEMSVKELARGEYPFQTFTVTCYDFFGWIARTVTVQVPQQCLVYPKVEHIRHATLQAQFERGTKASPYALVKDTSMVTSVRNYQAGDRMSWIHWKSFAKTEQLRTKSFEDSQSQDLFVTMDLQAGAYFEQSVSLTASLLQTFVKHQSDVIFMTIGEQRRLFPVLHSSTQEDDVMRYLASVQPETTSSTYRQLSHEPIVQQVHALVYITTVFDEQMLQFFKLLNKQVTCFVIQQEPQQTKVLQQIRIIYVQPTNFEHVLMEVAKR